MIYSFMTRVLTVNLEPPVDNPEALIRKRGVLKEDLYYRRWPRTDQPLETYIQP